MYAISNLIDGEEPSWRAVNSIEDLSEGEISVDDIPINPVWDNSLNGLRSMTDAELAAQQSSEEAAAELKQQRINNVIAALPTGVGQDLLALLGIT